MAGNSNYTPIGRCSKCGGIVSLPKIWMSVNRPVATCENCGGIAEESQKLPIIEVKPASRTRTGDATCN